jgi:hypothetical protein
MKNYGPEALAILNAARHADDPSEIELRRVGRAVALRVGVGAAVMLSSSTAWGGLWAKVTIVVVLASVGGAGTGLWWRSTHRAKVNAPVVSPVTVRATLPAAPAAPPPAVAPSAVSSVERAPARRIATPRRAVMAARPVEPTRLEEETAVMANVNRKLDAGQQSQALWQLDEYDRRFPRGVLREESDATRAIVHCQIAGGRDAAAQARQFKAKHATSPLLPRVEHACLGDPR